MEPVEVVVHADHVHVLERLIVAPAAGVFRPQPAVTTAMVGTVEAGQTVGAIECIGGDVDIVSPHTGQLMGLLTLPTDRVRDQQPLAWVRTPDRADDDRGTGA